MSIIDQLKGKYAGFQYQNEFMGGISGRALNMFYPEIWNARSQAFFNSRDPQASLAAGDRITFQESYNMARATNVPRAFEIGLQHGRQMKNGGMFSPKASTRLLLAMDNSVRKTVDKASVRGAIGGYKIANTLTKAGLGISAGAAAGGLAVAAGLAYAATSLVSDTPGRTLINTGKQVHQMMKEMSRPQYGYSELGQSTQGLVFGLNNRRHG